MITFTQSNRKGPLSDRLRERGYSLEEAYIQNRLCIRMTAPNSKRIWVTGKNMAYPMNSEFVYEVANNKQLSYALAANISINIPASFYVNKGSNNPEIINFLETYNRVIVKPLDSYKSRGVTLNIKTIDALLPALTAAYQESSTAIIQEQVRGEEYRFTVLEGRVISILRRERPQIMGNGIDTVHDLVKAENTVRQTIPAGVISYPHWTPELLGEIVNSEEVLERGEIKLLSNTTLVSRGASVYELLDQTDNSYIQLVEKYVAMLGAGFVAVDMFILDHTVPATAGNYWFNECNASPSLKMYYASRNKDVSWIADNVVDAVDKYLNFK